MIKCPLCKKTKTELLKDWSYGTIAASRYECKNCKKAFNFYKNLKGKIWTIPKNKLSKATSSGKINT